MNRAPIFFLLALLVLLITVAFFLPKVKNLKNVGNVSPTPTKSLEDLLVPTKAPDDFPQNTLDIPADKWNEKYPALALRALRYFQEQGIVSQTIAQDKIEDYQNFLRSWGKAWRLHFLKAECKNNELQLIWEQILIVQANSPKELEEAKKKVTGRLAEIQPPVELAEGTDLSKHYATEEDVKKAIRAGELVLIKTTNIKLPESLYSKKPLAEIIKNTIDPQLNGYKDILELTSATRSLELQNLLRKLGYYATKVSYHTMGAGVDFRFSSDVKKNFDENYLKKPIQEGSEKNRLDRLNELHQQGAKLTLDTLIEKGILPQDHEMAKTYAILKQSAAGKPLILIDGTPFGIRFDDKTGKVKDFRPVFFLQYTGT